RIVPIDVPKRARAGIALDGLIERRAELQQIGRQFIELEQSKRLPAAQPLDGGLNARLGKRILPPMMLDSIDLHELCAQNILEQNIRELPSPFTVHIELRQHHPFWRHRLQQMQRRYLRKVFLAVPKLPPIAHWAASTAVDSAMRPIS